MPLSRIDVEAWVHQVAEQVARGAPFEDDRVEAKVSWDGDHQRAARQLAGQANAAGGAPILWIVGLERTRGIVGATDAELTGWWQAVRARFDEGVEPALRMNINVRHEEHTLVALLFDTDAAPYVLRLPNPLPGGSCRREVPIRAATGTDTARRQDLVRILAPIRARPDIEVRYSQATQAVRMGDADTRDWSLEWKLFLLPPAGPQAVIVLHRSRVELGVEGQETLYSERPTFEGHPPDGPVVNVFQAMYLTCKARFSLRGPIIEADTLVATLRLGFAEIGPIILRERMSTRAPVPGGVAGSRAWARPEPND